VRWRDAEARHLVARLGTQWLPPFSAPTADLVKSNARRMVYRLRTPDGEFAVKTHFREGLDRLGDLFRGAPADRELATARFAADQGIAAVDMLVAARLACNRNGVCLSVSLSHWMTHAGSLDQCWQSAAYDPRQLIDAAATLMASAHAAGLLVADCHPGNLVVRESPEGGLFCAFIDLGTARQVSAATPGQVARNLAALHQWFARRSSARQRWRFLRQYHVARDVAPRRPTMRRVAADIEKEAVRHAFRQYRKRDRRIPRVTRRGRTSRFFEVLASSGGWQTAVTRRLRGLLDQLPLTVAVEQRGDETLLDSAALIGARAGGSPPAFTLLPEARCWQASGLLAALRGGWFGTAAEHRYRSACLALNRDLPAVGNLACAVRRRRGLAWEACLYEPEPAAGRRWLDAAEPLQRGERPAQLAAVAELLANTLRAGLVMLADGRDVIGLCRCERGWRAYWIEVRACALREPASDAATVWMLATLWRGSAPRTLSRTDRCRLLIRLARTRGGCDWRTLWQGVAGVVDS
jgi:hypothetical protein